jgi:DNA-binding NtrC family response regulator
MAAASLPTRLAAVREAAGGTLFLKHISRLSLSDQERLLRLIEQGESPSATPSGQTEQFDVRVVCSTRRNLLPLERRRRFRSDLFYRLEPYLIELPPLRERRGDLLALAGHFIAEAVRRCAKQVFFSRENLERLRSLPWRGNARELRAVIERLILMAEEGETIHVGALELLMLRLTGGGTTDDPWQDFSLAEEVEAMEGRFIVRALEEARGSVTGAAQLLGYRHHGSLAALLKNRHRSLAYARKPVAKRRRSLIDR